jgi:hypothetical protein
MKEMVRAIFAKGLSVEAVAELIDRLLARFSRCRLQPFIRLGKTIRKHRDGILAARRLKLSNARAEALNNKAKLIARRAYGFHSEAAALALVHLTCGPINLTLPHEQAFAWLHLRSCPESLKTTGHFPNEDAARKLVYLATQNAVPLWTRTRNWTTALLAFKIHFGDRIPDGAD